MISKIFSEARMHLCRPTTVQSVAVELRAIFENIENPKTADTVSTNPAEKKTPQATADNPLDSVLTKEKEAELAQKKAGEVIKNDYSEDIQKWLDKFDTKTQLNLKLPSRWLQSDTSKNETPGTKADSIYKKLFFGADSPLKNQFEELQKAQGASAPASIEEMVFGKGEAAKDSAERAVRIKAIQIRLENLRNLKERQKEKLSVNRLVETVSEGSKNIIDSLKNNISEKKWVEAGIQIASIYLLFSAAKALLFKPEGKSWGANLRNIVLKAAVGIGLLVPSATKGRTDAFDWLKLTNYSDKLGDRGLGRLMKNMDMRTRTEAETVDAIAKIDIGDLHRAYEEARAEGRSKIDPRDLIEGKVPRRAIVNDKDVFRITEAILKRYGAKYFELLKGRPPKTSQEVQDSITVFVRYHKQTKVHSKSFGNVIAYEESSYEDWQKGKAPLDKGKLLILTGIAKSVGMGILEPTKALEHLGEAFYGWLGVFGIDRESFDKNIKDPVKNKIAETYKNNKPQAEAFMKDISGFMKSGWAKLLDNPEKFITDVGMRGIDVAMNLAGATLKGIYKVGAGMTNITLAVAGKVYKNVEAHVEEKGTIGNTIVFAPWIPYSYDSEKKEWKRASFADAGKGAVAVGGEIVGEAIFTAKWWKTEYFGKMLPKQWKEDIKPMFDEGGGIFETYKAFEDFTKMVMEEDIIPAGKATGESLEKFFTDENNIILSFVRATKEAGIKTWDEFKNLGVSVAKFLAESAKEMKEKEQNITDFDALISDSEKEKEYFWTKGGKVEDLEPKVRAWLFEKLGGWNLDIDRSSVKYNSAVEIYIEYEKVTLESIGTALPLFGNKECKLRINFSANGNLGGGTRFELTPEGLPTLNLNPEDFASRENLEKKVEDAEEIKSRQEKLVEMQKVLGDNGNGKFTLAGKEFNQVSEFGGLGKNFDWLSEGSFFKYSYKDAHGNLFEIGIPIPSRRAFYFGAAEIAPSKLTTFESLKKKVGAIIEQKNKEAKNKLATEKEESLKKHKVREARERKVLQLRRKLGDNLAGRLEFGGSLFSEGRFFEKIDSNGGLNKAEDWHDDDAYFIYKYENPRGKYFIKIPVSPDKPIIFEAPGETPMESNSPQEIKKVVTEELTAEENTSHVKEAGESD